ncbi:MAG: 30S ribosome-binding factor RbfA [Candidatus Krumholzibacteria bacterium]|nr:30S ribosome-binding factor RbfA [Candidatus Krumholzibacteria bacterium]
MSDRSRGRMVETIRQLIAELLVRRVKDPRVGDVSILRVELSRDCSTAKIFYNLIGGGAADAEAAAAGLASCRGYLRGQVKRAVRLRVIPELIFIYDASLDRAMHIEELIDSIRADEEGRPGNEDGGEGDR